MRRTIVLLGASVLALAGCTTENNGTPSTSAGTPSQTLPSGPADEVPGPGVPRVESPIDITHFQQAPCDSLTTTQVSELLGSGVTPKPDLNSPAGPSCIWNTPRISQAGAHVTFTNVDKLGLTSIYRAQGKKYPFFVQMDPIDGYPIVAYGVADERSNRGRCTVALGTSDTQVADINIAQSEENIGKKDPCAAAHDVAAKVLGNLKAGK